MRAFPRSAGSRALATYLSEIGRVPLLGVDREQELARCYVLTGSPHAAQQLVNSNLRLVVKLALEFRTSGLGLADLIQEGNLGLIRAVETFDPDRQVRLISYARWWIRAYLRSYVIKNWSLVRFGTTRAQRRLFFSLRSVQRDLGRRRGSAGGGSDAEEVARTLQVQPRDVEEMEAWLGSHDLSLDAPLAEQSGMTHLDLVEGLDEPQDMCLAARERAAIAGPKINRALEQRDARERFIVVQRFMVEPAQSLQELGVHYGVSRERTRQLEVRAKEKLRHQLQGLAEELCLGKAA